MSYPIAVLTTRPGQGSTTFALSLAWDLSTTRTVTLVDADMMGGTVADALELDTEGRGIANLLTSNNVDVAVLEAQAMVHPARPSLRVVAGLRGFSGPSLGRLMPRLAGALTELESDFTVIDMGCPLAFPDLESPRVTAETIAHGVRRTLVVLRDDPTFLPGSIQLLKFARVPQADLVVMRRRGSRMGRIAHDVLGVQLPGYPTWLFDWDEKRGQQATYDGRVLEQPGLADTLRLPPPVAMR
jgi:MinD-like ATPase involved in chromosome partitioning or flagellar assembly